MGQPFIPTAPNCSLASGNLRKRRSHIARNSVFQKLRILIYLWIFLQCMEFNSCISIIYSGHFVIWCPGLHQKSGRSSVVVGWFLKCQRAGWREGRTPVSVACCCYVANPKREYSGISQKVAIYFIVLFSCTYFKEDISQECEQLLAPSGIEDQGGLRCVMSGPAQTVAA